MDHESQSLSGCSVRSLSAMLLCQEAIREAKPNVEYKLRRYRKAYFV